MEHSERGARHVKAAPSKEARQERLLQRAVRMTPKPRKGTRAKRRREAIRDAMDMGYRMSPQSYREAGR